MNVGSLFSGIGGLDAGLARAGLRHAFFCEIDEWRREVLGHHWPDARIYSDVAFLGPSVGHVDLLCGGFPCQDLSVAGRRRGLDGAKSSLFYEFARIAESLRPRWLLIENVPGLLSSNGGRDFGVLLGTLADLGYGLGWRTLDSRYFGVPQRRRRVFILGAEAGRDPRAAADRAGQVLAVGTRCSQHPATSGEEEQAGNGQPEGGFGAGGISGTLGGRGGGTGGGGGRADDLDGVGTYVSGPLGTLTGGHKQDLDGQGAYVIAQNQRGEIRQSDVAMQLTGGGGKPGEGYGAVGSELGVRKLMPVECERLQALPDGWTDFGPDTRRYAALGDAVTATVAEWIGRRLISTEERGE